MIGSTAIADSQMVAQKPSCIAPIQASLTALNGDKGLFRSNSCSENTILSVINEDSQMSSPPFVNTQPQITSLNLTNGSIFGNGSQKVDTCETSINNKAFKTEIPMVINESTSATTSGPVAMVEPVPHYLPLNSFGAISSNSMVENSPHVSVVEPMPAINSMNCDPILQPMSSAQITAISSSPSLSMVTVSTVSNPVSTNTITIQESDAMKSLIAQNPVLTSTASTTPVTTQANNISALSEMTDAELLRFINPETFDQSIIQNNISNYYN